MSKHTKHETNGKSEAKNEPIGENESEKEAVSSENISTADENEKNETIEPENTGSLEKRNTELEKLCADLQDQYLRKAADFDNYRKRMIKEKQEAIDFANTNLLTDLVQILDDFDRATLATGGFEEGSSASVLAQGVVMIRNQLGSMLESKYGLTYYPAKGELFDPNIHEAIGQVSTPDIQEPTVAEEYMKGYKLKDRVLRHAKVMVQMPAEK